DHVAGKIASSRDDRTRPCQDKPALAGDIGCRARQVVDAAAAHDHGCGPAVVEAVVKGRLDWVEISCRSSIEG
ncbi:hypothetical protein, partial [Streptococcus pneumoniae]|uniref:hypothetical protein n=1 Tax=Streptococcus pneumoniae TaxID=1313 RepID=UPI001953BD4B